MVGAKKSFKFDLGKALSKDCFENMEKYIRGRPSKILKIAGPIVKEVNL
jgi:hypothetical protein